MPVHHWGISRNAARYLDELRRTQWLPREELEELQMKRLRRLLHHAQAHVGYYRELFQTAGITPESIRTLDDLRRIPVLTKQALRENLYFDLLSDNHDKRKIYRVTTSGSTGEPLALGVAQTAREGKEGLYLLPQRVDGLATFEQPPLRLAYQLHEHMALPPTLAAKAPHHLLQVLLEALGLTRERCGSAVALLCDVCDEFEGFF